MRACPRARAPCPEALQPSASDFSRPITSFPSVGLSRLRILIRVGTVPVHVRSPNSVSYTREEVPSMYKEPPYTHKECAYGIPYSTKGFSYA